jgi:hypothetical protein
LLLTSENAVNPKFGIAPVRRHYGFLMYVCGMVYIRILLHRTGIQAIENRKKAGPPVLGGGKEASSARQRDCNVL